MTTLPGQLVWEELESTLASQLDRARSGDFTAVDGMMSRLGTLLDMLSEYPPTDQTAPQARRVQRMYHDLQLALQAEKADIANRLARIRKGQKALRGYRNA